MFVVVDLRARQTARLFEAGDAGIDEVRHRRSATSEPPRALSIAARLSAAHKALRRSTFLNGPTLVVDARCSGCRRPGRSRAGSWYFSAASLHDRLRHGGSFWTMLRAFEHLAADDRVVAADLDRRFRSGRRAGSRCSAFQLGLRTSVADLPGTVADPEHFALRVVLQHVRARRHLVVCRSCSRVLLLSNFSAYSFGTGARQRQHQRSATSCRLRFGQVEDDLVLVRRFDPLDRAARWRVGTPSIDLK